MLRLKVKHFSTQNLLQNTLHFIEHINLFQVVKHFLRIHISEQWLQRSFLKIVHDDDDADNGIKSSDINATLALDRKKSMKTTLLTKSA